MAPAECGEKEMLSKEDLVAKVLAENEIDRSELYLAKDENANLRSGSYADVIVAEMRHNRLPDADHYFTCDDFACFDVKCEELCHSDYSHYDTWVVTLADGSFAWVCDPLKDVLRRQIDDRRRDRGTPIALLLDSIFGGAEPSLPLLQNHPDRQSVPIYQIELPSSLEAGGTDYDYLGALVEANEAAESDDVKLRCCLRYVHHTHGRKGPATQTIDAIVEKTRGLHKAVSAPAIGCDISGKRKPNNS